MRWKAVSAGAAVVVVVVAGARVPLPALERCRQWSAESGPWFVLAFFVAYCLVTVLPVPRSAFTYTAAVLFSPVVAIPVCLVATGVAATLAFHAVHHLGHARAERLRHDPRIARVDRRLARRGWVSVTCLRMVPAVPFSVLNYACALSSIRFAQFLPATVLGSAPGTVAAILLGQAVTTGSSGWAVWATACFAAVGFTGLVLDARLPPRERPAPVTADGTPDVSPDDTPDVTADGPGSASAPRRR